MIEKKKEVSTGGKTVTGKPAEKIITEPTEKTIRESLVVTFGRFNPPTKGHERLVETLKYIAEDLNADPAVYLSHSHNEKNPLSYDLKLDLCEEAFGTVVKPSSYRNLFEVLQNLPEKYKEVYVVLGEDRAELFADRLSDYTWDTLLHLEVISIPRDQYSASSARRFVAEGKLLEFVDCLPESIQYRADEIYEAATGDSSNILISNRLMKYITPQAEANLQEKADKYGVALEILEQVLINGLLETHWDVRKAFQRVNSFAAGNILEQDQYLAPTSKRVIKEKAESPKSVSEKMRRYVVSKKQKQFQILQDD